MIVGDQFSIQQAIHKVIDAYKEKDFALKNRQLNARQMSEINARTETVILEVGVELVTMVLADIHRIADAIETIAKPPMV